MYRLFFPLLYLFCLVSGSSFLPTLPADGTSQSDFHQIFPLALRGEMQQVFAILDTIDETQLSTQELNLKARYYERFIHGTEHFEYHTQDSAVMGFVDQFHTYWKTAMLGKQPLAQVDSLFLHSMSRYLFQAQSDAVRTPYDSIYHNLASFSNTFLEEKGYFANAMGKTGAFYDLFLWKKNEIHSYPIILIEDSVRVEVHLMDEFISLGWSHYTTFGRSYAGGWATREALYCVASAYDLESESFLHSYLPHEGQHFADYQTFPRLKQRDLEYRAKLVELSKSQQNTYQLIEKFLHHAAEQSHDAHAFANYCVIRDLSQAIYRREYVAATETWQSCEADQIRQHSIALFLRHTEQLEAMGRDTVTCLIR